MSRETQTLPLPQMTPGTQRHIRLHRYGRGLTVKAYIQAALHANETPAQLVALHLLDMLDGADRSGLIRGEVVVLPAANPIGLSQVGRSHLHGRFHRRTGRNFNRAWPDLAALVGDLDERLTQDPDHNVATVRDAMREAVRALPVKTDDDALRKLLTAEACDASLVLDLHCDDVALPYLYASPLSWPDLSDFAADLGARAVLLAEDSGGRSFDEAFSRPWAILADRHPRCPIPQATTALTVELRGQADVNDTLARADATAIFRALARRGFIDVDVPPPPPLQCTASDTAACEFISASAPGLVVYSVTLGQQVARGQRIAAVLDPTAADPWRSAVYHCAGTDGMVLSLRSHRAVSPGQSIAKIVGTTPLRGPLLED